ncbi:MAG: hypothetical protein WC071_12130 [Victivallaceae bacterium]
MKKLSVFFKKNKTMWYWSLPVFLCFSFVLQGSPGDVNFSERPSKKIESLDDLLPKVVRTLITWPPPDELKKMKILDRSVLSVKAPCEWAEDWVNNVFSVSWHPPKDAKILIIKSEARGYDTIRWKWKKDNYDIQMGQVFSTFTLRISKLDKNSFGGSQAERIENIKKLAAEVFSNTGNSWDKQGNIIKINISGLINKSFNLDKIKSIPLNNDSIIYYTGEPFEVLRTWKKDGNTYGTSRDVPWYEMISWFNNKNMVCFYFLKNEGCSPIYINFESQFNSKLFEISSRCAIYYACKEANKLKLKYDKKKIKTKHENGQWSVIFNPGEKTETTIFIDDITGKARQ